MKRNLIIILFSVLFSVFSMTACGDDEDYVPLLRPLPEYANTDSLRVICIGHSFSADAFTYVSSICSNMRLDVSNVAIYQCVRGSATFKSWVNCWNDQDGGKYTISKALYAGFDIPNLACGKTEGTNGAYFRNAIQDNKWDVVIFCNGEDKSEDWNDPSKGGYLSVLDSLIRKYQPSAKYYYLMPHQMWLTSTKDDSLLLPYSVTQGKWAKYTERMKWIETCGFEMMIPVGTAIENIRKTGLNHEDGIPTFNLTRDGWHLGTGLAQYTASCCMVEKLLAPRYGVTVLDNTLRPIRSNVYDYRFPSGCISVTESNAKVAKMAAYLAVKYPYELSDVDAYLNSQGR